MSVFKANKHKIRNNKNQQQPNTNYYQNPRVGTQNN